MGAAKKQQETSAPTPEPEPSIRAALKAFAPAAAHVEAAAKLGHDVAHIVRQIDASLVDVLAGLRQLESTASGDGADEIKKIVERLA
jgi:hypothetical protein